MADTGALAELRQLSLLPDYVAEAALKPASASAKREPELLEEADVARIESAPWQPRSVTDDAELRALVESVREHGVLEPVLARPAKGGRLQLLAGHRRLEAARLAGLRTVPVRVVEASDVRARAITLAENLARKDLSAWEEAQALAALRDALAEAGERVTRDRLAAVAGRSGGAVSESLAIADRLTPEVLALAGVADRQTLTGLPKSALHNASRGEGFEARAALLRRALEAERAPAQATARALRRAAGGRPPRPFTLSDQLARKGRLSFTLRRPPEQLQPEEARALLDRLGPVLDALRERAGGGE